MPTLHSYPRILTHPQRLVVRRAGRVLTARGFYLGGGMAVAINLGHRRPEDFEWFLPEPLGPVLDCVDELRATGLEVANVLADKGSLRLTALGVPVSLSEHPYPLLEPLVSWPAGRCQVASLADLSAMKLLALTGRGEKKDFVDVYALGTKYRPLPELLDLCKRKYSLNDASRLRRAVGCFGDVSYGPMPKMVWEVEWPDIKRTLGTWAKRRSR